jgi:hypothetical protein
VFGRPVRYSLNNTASLLCSGYFGDDGLAFCLGWPGLQFSNFKLCTGAGITRVCHHVQFFSVEMGPCKLSAQGWP